MLAVCTGEWLQDLVVNAILLSTWSTMLPLLVNITLEACIAFPTNINNPAKLNLPYIFRLWNDFVVNEGIALCLIYRSCIFF